MDELDHSGPGPAAEKTYPPSRLSGRQSLRLLAVGALVGVGFGLVDVYREDAGGETAVRLALSRVLRGVVATGFGLLVGGRLSRGGRGLEPHRGLFFGYLYGSMAGQLARPLGLATDLVLASLFGAAGGVAGAVNAVIVSRKSGE